MNEIFVDVLKYEGLYKVSNLGNVLNVKKNKLLTNNKNTKGYLRVTLSKDGKRKTCSIHRLVATAFIKNPLNLPQVNHRDENKTNNNVNNLEWCTSSYNNNYGTKVQRALPKILANPNYKATREKCLNAAAEKLSKQVLQFNKQGEFVKEYPSIADAAKTLGIDQSIISKCCLGRKYHKSAGGYIWKYKHSA